MSYNICCSREDTKCLPYALTKEATWMIRTPNTVVLMWTTNFVQDDSSTLTALVGLINKRSKNPKDILYGELTVGKRT